MDFSYEDEQILKDYSIDFRPGQIVGIHGSSGSGKSTLLKLLMRFWDVQSGTVKISDENIRGKRIVGIEIRIADVIAFDEIHAPGGVQFQQRIVVSLPLRGSP